MQLPTPAAPIQLESLSPSRYNSALICPARALWSASVPSNVLPTAPGAMLGSSFHKVMEAANRGRLIGDAQAVREQAHRIFDDEAAKQIAQAHPLVRAKFRSPNKLPDYHLKRAGAAERAVNSSGINLPPMPSRVSALPAVNPNAPLVEVFLASKDELLKGRLDYFDPAEGLLTDYKSGMAPPSGGLSEGESRQLLFYAHLLWENSYQPQEAVIVRPGGKEARLAVTPQAATVEGQAARALLAKLNDDLAAGRLIEDTATPSAQNCSGCPFIALCPAFWDAAAPEWVHAASSGASVGVQAEGQVLAARSGAGTGSLTTLELEVRRGTAPRGRAILEQVPTAWFTCDGDHAPQVESVVRVTSAALMLSSVSEPEVPSITPLPPTSLRVDRYKTTAVWTV